MCVITAYGVQCLVAGCRGSRAEQQAMCPERDVLYDSSCATSLFLDTYPAALHLTSDNQPQALHTIGGNNTHIVSSS